MESRYAFNPVIIPGFLDQARLHPSTIIGSKLHEKNQHHSLEAAITVATKITQLPDAVVSYPIVNVMQVLARATEDGEVFISRDEAEDYTHYLATDTPANKALLEARVWLAGRNMRVILFDDLRKCKERDLDPHTLALDTMNESAGVQTNTLALNTTNERAGVRTNRYKKVIFCCVLTGVCLLVAGSTLFGLGLLVAGVAAAEYCYKKAEYRTTTSNSSQIMNSSTSRAMGVVGGGASSVVVAQVVPSVVPAPVAYPVVAPSVNLDAENVSGVRYYSSL